MVVVYVLTARAENNGLPEDVMERLQAEARMNVQLIECHQTVRRRLQAGRLAEVLTQ